MTAPDAEGRTIHVSLSDVPTDVLVHLVDNAPGALLNLVKAVRPADLEIPAAWAKVDAALSLLSDLGLAELRLLDALGGGKCWTATAAGREAVAEARTVPIHPVHPDWCMRNCGCVKTAGHEGKCDLTGPLPSAGCRCLACESERAS